MSIQDKGQYGGSGLTPGNTPFGDKVAGKLDDSRTKVQDLLTLLHAGNHLIVVIEGNKFKFAKLSDFENPHNIIILKRDRKNFYTATVSEMSQAKNLPHHTDETFAKAFVHPDGSEIFIKIQLSDPEIHAAAFAEFYDHFEAQEAKEAKEAEKETHHKTHKHEKNASTSEESEAEKLLEETQEDMEFERKMRRIAKQHDKIEEDAAETLRHNAHEAHRDIKIHIEKKQKQVEQTHEENREL